MKTTAIILAAGKGKRMGMDISKQYLILEGYPVLYYAVKAFEDSNVNNIILVVGQGEKEYCKETIVEPYGFKKVRTVIEGGKERYNSVYEGLRIIESFPIYTDIVLIHDGARPFVTKEIINKSIEGGKKYGACVTAVKAKDTVKLSDGNGFIKMTPDRSTVWQIQTPQTFSYNIIRKAYDRAIKEGEGNITDDAMVLEKYGRWNIKLLEGSYNNIKITTREDLIFGRAILAKEKKFEKNEKSC